MDANKGNFMIANALLSVSDKRGIVEFAKNLSSINIKLFSTGRTGQVLSKNGIPFTYITDYTGHPEIMEGRVKTLHPKIFGGLLCRRTQSTDLQELKALDISLIDMVVVNLYPFEAVTRETSCTLEHALENIDIGGPCMIRAAAKNYRDVAVVTDPQDYSRIWEEIQNKKELSLSTRENLAVRGFQMTQNYDATIENYLSAALLNRGKITQSFQEIESLRYGENPHQKAKRYQGSYPVKHSATSAKILNGKAMSYNNYLDADAALKCVCEFTQPAVVIMKHNIPCGLALSQKSSHALKLAWEGDSVSAFGGIIATNKSVTLDFSEFLSKKFIEVIIAPSYEHEALKALKRAKPNLRLLQYSQEGEEEEKFDFRFIRGGLLQQERDTTLSGHKQCLTDKAFPKDLEPLVDFGLVCCQHLKSNAIVLARLSEGSDFQLIGAGSGQPNRIDACERLAIPKARKNLSAMYEKEKHLEQHDQWIKKEFSQLVMVSDAFFPFGDIVEIAHQNHIRFIVQPGGSKNDQASIDLCNRYGISMLFTGLRHFSH